ncbi:MAG: site-specific DNA-methyltransferase [Chloroflexi bacterium]|nr:site-specific DNA-methyltransferase [Chloroflexota bacterium]
MPTLDFKGKRSIYSHHLTLAYRELIPDPSLSLDPKALADDNLIVHGDNLLALKALLAHYSGRIQCIYIAPPYNTGNGGWVYDDRVGSPDLLDWLRQNLDEGAKITVDGKDLERHDKWACMMWPRLHLLKELLADSGVIFVSIDDNEHHHLRLMMDEIFGEANFIISLVVIPNLSGSSDQFGFAGTHEHCLVYARNRAQVRLGEFPIDDDELEKWEKDDVGYYRSEALQRGGLTFSPSLHYPIFVGPCDEIVVTEDDQPPAAGGPYTAVLPATRNNPDTSIWRWSKQRIWDKPGDVFARRRENGNVAIYSKQRPSNGRRPTAKPKSLFYKREYSSRAGGETLRAIFPESPGNFPYPKSVELLKDIVRIGAPGDDDIILDSFAGTGTTGHAVLELNREDGSNRRFILVEKEEYADSITAERIRRVSKGVRGPGGNLAVSPLGGSFTFCALGNPTDADPHVDPRISPGL